MNVALIGFGYWGPNLGRQIAGSEGASLHSICDTDPQKRERAERMHPHVKVVSDAEAVLGDPNIDAVAIATPVSTHYPLTKQALEFGKHVLVEKPMATTVEDCNDLIHLAHRAERVLMVGHVFLFSPPVRRIKEYIDDGLLGTIYYVYSQRLNLGIIRKDVNALWNFAPHDLSILDYWFGGSPSHVAARGYSFIQPTIEDVVFMTLDYPNDIAAHVHISWLDPRKARIMTVVGSEKMIVYNDTDPEARVMIFDKGVDKMHLGSPGDAVSLGQYDTFGEFQLLLRAGDVIIPRLSSQEPLAVQFQHFLDCIEHGDVPLTDGKHAVRVIETLEAAQASLDNDGSRWPVGR